MVQREFQTSRARVDYHMATVTHLARQQHAAECGFELALDNAAQRTRAVNQIIAMLGEIVARLIRQLQVDTPATRDLATWKPGESEQLAEEYPQLAETDVYQALGIPEKPCELYSCDPAIGARLRSAKSIWSARGRSPGANMQEQGIDWRQLLNHIWSP